MRKIIWYSQRVCTHCHCWRSLFHAWKKKKKKSPHTHERNEEHTCTSVIHGYNTMNKASLLSLSLSLSPCSVWVTVQILPVIREQSLKQPPLSPFLLSKSEGMSGQTHTKVSPTTTTTPLLHRPPPSTLSLPAPLSEPEKLPCRTPFSVLAGHPLSILKHTSVNPHL